MARQSVIELARERFSPKLQTSAGQSVESLEVLEKDFTMKEPIDSANGDRLVAAFAVGTASFVQHVSEIVFRGRQLRIGIDKTQHVSLLRDWLTHIVLGKETSSWAMS
ncbi:Fc.00g068460.m01.CDS01 [Cosmosporella sp. VM-42]